MPVNKINTQIHTTHISTENFTIFFYLQYTGVFYICEAYLSTFKHSAHHSTADCILTPLTGTHAEISYLYHWNATSSNCLSYVLVFSHSWYFWRFLMSLSKFFFYFWPFEFHKRYTLYFSWATSFNSVNKF